MKKQGKANHGKKQGLFRFITLALAFCLLLANVPFVSEAATSKISGHGYVDLNADTVTFQKNKVLLKEKDFTITTKSLETQDNGYILVELTIRNTGKQSLYFRSQGGEIGGYNVGTSLYAEIRPGKKATVRVSVDALPLAAMGMDLIRQVNVNFDVLNEKTWETLYEACTLTIPLGVPISMTYNAYKKCLYEENAFRLTLLGSAKVANRTSPNLIFLLENNLDGPIMARNEGELSVNNTEYDFYMYETATAYNDAVFSVAAGGDIFEEVRKGGTATMDFPIQICTGNLNPLVDIQVRVGITEEGKVKQFNSTSAKSRGYQSSMKEYNTSKNLFMGMFQNYEPDEKYIASLRRKYGKNQVRYSDRAFTPYVNELLALYLADLEDNGFSYGVIERPDLCNERAYVVELTEDGESVIQVAFAIDEYDPKAATMVTLGCNTYNYQDLDQLNKNSEAMWLAYETLNVRMASKKNADLIVDSQTSYSETLGTMLRGQYDGLAYFNVINEQEAYLIITPDMTLSIFDGMFQEEEKAISGELKVGSTISFGSYEQDNDITNGPEAIRWIILAKEEGKILVVSQHALDTRRFNETAGDVEWNESSIRTWLNGEFYKTAFGKEEQKTILSETVDVTAGADKVFLLSRHEAELYLPGSERRVCYATDYAKARGAYVNSKTNGSWWLLRTDGKQKGAVMSVNSDGTMDYNGGKVQSDKGVVRPAMWIRTTG